MVRIQMLVLCLGFPFESELDQAIEVAHLNEFQSSMVSKSHPDDDNPIPILLQMKFELYTSLSIQIHFHIPN